MAKRDIRLTPTSYIVLGLISAAERATPYDLKQMHASGIGGFWTLNHAQLYAEPDRLVDGGYLQGEREEGGGPPKLDELTDPGREGFARWVPRRPKLYELTDLGREAFASWLATPTDEFTELRDPGLLQLFFGASPAALAD